MYQITEKFIQALNYRHMTYEYRGLNHGAETVTLAFSGDPELTLHFFFDQENYTVTVQVFELIRSGSSEELLKAINAANEEYGYVKLYHAPKDRAVHVRVDAFVSNDSAAFVCIQLIRRILGVCMEVYPVLKKMSN